MTKYNVVAARRPAQPRTGVNAVWRGVGCLLILVVPVLSYLLASATVQIAIAQNWPMPHQLMGYPVMPSLIWRAAPGLGPVLAFIQGLNNLFAVLAIATVFVVVIGALISFGYSLIYRLVGPPRYGPLDAPPPALHVKQYKR